MIGDYDTVYDGFYQIMCDQAEPHDLIPCLSMTVLRPFEIGADLFLVRLRGRTLTYVKSCVPLNPGIAAGNPMILAWITILRSYNALAVETDSHTRRALPRSSRDGR